MRFNILGILILGLLIFTTGDDADAQRSRRTSYNKGKRYTYESKLNRKKTGMLNTSPRSKRSKRMGYNQVKRKKTQYSRSDYYTSRARGKKARSKSFKYRSRGTRHNASNPYRSGKKKFGYTQTSPFKAKKKRDYRGSNNKGTRIKSKRRKTDRGTGKAYRYNKRQPGQKSSKNFTSRKNKRTARKKPDYNKSNRKYKNNRKKKSGGRQMRMAKRRGGKAKPDFSYNRRKYEKNKRKNMKKSTRKRLNPRG